MRDRGRFYEQEIDLGTTSSLLRRGSQETLDTVEGVASHAELFLREGVLLHQTNFTVAELDSAMSKIAMTRFGETFIYVNVTIEHVQLVVSLPL